MSNVNSRMGHDEEANALKSECLKLVEYDDDLWTEIFDRAVIPATTKPSSSSLVPPRPPTPEFDHDVLRLLSKLTKLDEFETLLAENVRISRATQDRMDLVYDKLVDLDQRTELTWETISKSARGYADYAGAVDSIASELRLSLGEVWSQLAEESREDLTDAEYV
jgi:hypothetical protein